MQTMFDLYESLNSEIHVQEEGKHQNRSLGLRKKLFIEIILCTRFTGLQ